MSNPPSWITPTGKILVYAPEFTFSPRHRHKPAKLVSASRDRYFSETNIVDDFFASYS